MNPFRGKQFLYSSTTILHWQHVQISSAVLIVTVFGFPSFLSQTPRARAHTHATKPSPVLVPKILVYPPAFIWIDNYFIVAFWKISSFEFVVVIGVNIYVYLAGGKGLLPATPPPKPFQCSPLCYSNGVVSCASTASF